MKVVSIFNHVLGPVMRGPSSSHTAGAFHISLMARSLLDDKPARAIFSFDTDGSYAKTYEPQGADRAFALGLLGRELIDECFFDALNLAVDEGLRIEFDVTKLKQPDHPNTVDIELQGAAGGCLSMRARSVGGGAVEIVRLDRHAVHLTGEAYEAIIEVDTGCEDEVIAALDDGFIGEVDRKPAGGRTILCVRQTAAMCREVRDRLASLTGVVRVRESQPVYFVHKGQPLFASAADLAGMADETGKSLGQLGLEYEAALLGLSEREVLDEMVRRYEIMAESVRQGLSESPPQMQLLGPSAGAIFAAEAAGRLPAGGLGARAAARAMAIMHVNGGMGVVCAAPTGGAAGTLPGVIVTFAEEKGLGPEQAAMALLAAGAIGVIVATRATFAAEVAGCQVEIGAAGAMAAAAVVDIAGGTVLQAADAAAISFQNSMGSICDLVQGIVEIPCHTRNAAAAAGALLCADLILGGYVNPIALDETIDAVFACGKMLPPELRCTSRGGLAVTPSALAMQRCGQV